MSAALAERTDCDRFFPDWPRSGHLYRPGQVRKASPHILRLRDAKVVRKVYRQMGSFSQSEGNPIARRSILGYSANSALSSALKLLPDSIVQSRYAIIAQRK